MDLPEEAAAALEAEAVDGLGSRPEGDTRRIVAELPLDRGIARCAGLNPLVQTSIGGKGCYAANHTLSAAQYIVSAKPPAQGLVVKCEPGTQDPTTAFGCCFSACRARRRGFCVSLDVTFHAAHMILRARAL